jgi:hypothetical protein
MIFTRFLFTAGPRNPDIQHGMNETESRSSCASSAFRAGLLLVLIGAGIGQISFANTNPVKKENLKPGTTDWQLTNPADNRQIEGFASLTSVPQHGSIDLFVNTRDANYSLNVYRIGWYGGTGGRLVLGPITLPGAEQYMPSPDPVTGVFSCQWVLSYRIKVPYSWLSGVYLVKLHGNTSGKESYIIFTVRDMREAKIVFQQSVLTYHAYNPWPGNPVDGYIGASLYSFQTSGSLNGRPGYNLWGGAVQAQAVSLNRPYGVDPITVDSDPMLYGVGAGDFLHNVAPAAMEFDMVRWLEHEGYDVTYITDVDTHEDLSRLLRGKAFLSIGHDEYWSYEMKANVLQARDQGVSLGFFGSNYMYWPVELLPDSNGSPNRTLALAPQANHCVASGFLQQTQCAVDVDCSAGQVCGYKVADYSNNLDLNGVSETEQAIVGGMDEPGAVLDIHYGGDIVINADTQLQSWVFANTGLNYNDVIPGLIGIEFNSTRQDYPLPFGLSILTHEQAPNFAQPQVESNFGGGFDLPDDFDGHDFNTWYTLWGLFQLGGGQLSNTCDTRGIPPLNIDLTGTGFCRNPFPYYPGLREDWAMTIYQAGSGAWVFNAATNDWTWGLDDYFTGLNNGDGVNNGPQLPMRTQCGYPFFHPGLVSCRNPALEQLTRNVLNRFIGRH